MLSRRYLLNVKYTNSIFKIFFVYFPKNKYPFFVLLVYYKGTVNTNCRKSDIIANKDQCKKAATALGLNFWGEIDKIQHKIFPLGCFYNAHSRYIAFNGNTNGYTNPAHFGNRGGLCTTAQQKGILNIHLLLQFPKQQLYHMSMCYLITYHYHIFIPFCIRSCKRGLGSLAKQMGPMFRIMRRWIQV